MKTIAICQFAALAGLVSPAAADGHYRSRPELAVPKLNITVPAGDSVEKGLIFISPYEGFADGHSGPTQPGAYIYRDDGELVWSGTGYHAGWVANFRPDVWNGKQYLRAFQGRLDVVHGRMFGFHTLLGSDYQVAKVVGAGSHRLVSAHEFRLVDGKTALIETPIPRQVSLKPWGGDDSQNWVVSGGFQEVDIETGEVLFEWESFDHVDPKLSAFPLDFGPGLPGSGRNETDAWNYFHINSVDKDDEGNYLLSARNIGALFKINGTTGGIIWQLGGYQGGSDFELAEEDRFAFQHHARFRGRSADSSIETVTLFDNGAHSAPVKTHPFSRARVVQLNHTSGIATTLRTFDAPDGLSAHTQGSVQLLPNGNLFVNWGEAGAITEFDHDGQVLFHSYLDSAPSSYLVQSYRGFRANWTAIPAEDPAIVALRPEGDETGSSALDIFVSWNGDTETRAWHFYIRHAVDAQAAFLGKASRDGFETKFRAVGLRYLKDVTIFAEAIDGDGKTLRRTKAALVSVDLAHERTSVPGLKVQWPEEL